MLRGTASFTAIAVALALIAAIVASCATGGGISMAQRAYNACTDPYNEKLGTLSHYWAFVSGVDSSGGTCFWAWEAQTVAAATNSAMESCRKEYENCYLYSSSDGNSDWVQQISDNGGTDGSGGGGGGMSFSDFVEWGTFALSLGTIGVQTYDAIENNGSSGGGAGGYSTPAAGYGGGGGNCDEYLRLANECKVREQNMQSLVPVTPPGTSGPGGQNTQFASCYENYMGGYNACLASQ
jgi:hypothetical protein